MSQKLESNPQYFSLFWDENRLNMSGYNHGLAHLPKIVTITKWLDFGNQKRKPSFFLILKYPVIPSTLCQPITRANDPQLKEDSSPSALLNSTSRTTNVNFHNIALDLTLGLNSNINLPLFLGKNKIHISGNYIQILLHKS